MLRVPTTRQDNADAGFGHVPVDVEMRGGVVCLERMLRVPTERQDNADAAG
jgi:hypothetical protein